MYTCKKSITSSKASRAKNSIMNRQGFSKCKTTTMTQRELDRHQAQFISIENCIKLYDEKGISTVIG